MTASRFQLVACTGNAAFLDLLWEQPLEEWVRERLVEERALLDPDESVG